MSSPPRDHRASLDIQFISDHETDPSESMRREASVPQLGSRVDLSVIRLADDKIQLISQQVSSILS